MYPITLSVGILTARTLGPDGKGIYAFLVLLIKSMLPILFLGYGSGLQFHTASKQHAVQNSIFTNFLIAVFWGTCISFSLYALWHFELLGNIGKAIDKKLILPILFAIPFNAFFVLSGLFLKEYPRLNDAPRAPVSDVGEIGVPVVHHCNSGHFELWFLFA